MPRAADDFQANDTLLVLDLLTGAWLGVWKGDNFRMRHFLPFYDGTDPRMAILGADGDCWEMFGPTPRSSDDGEPIVMEARTSVRVDLSQSHSATLVAEIDDAGGRYQLACEADGMGEVNFLRGKRPDPADSLKYGGTVDFENDGDTLADPYRADYELQIPEEGTWLYESGWTLGARQRYSEAIRMPRWGRSFSISCASKGGRVAFRALAIQANTRPLGRGTEV